MKSMTFRSDWLIPILILSLALGTVYAVRELRQPTTEPSPPVATATNEEPATLTSEEDRSRLAPAIAPRSLIIPAGTVLRGSLQESLSTERTSAGHSFSLRVVSPVVIDGNTVVPAGSHITGTVVESQRSGRVKGRARMVLSFRALRTPSGEYHIAATRITRVAPGTKKRDAIMIGTGAGIGTAIGAIVGGKKGAAIGAATGGGAGTGVVLATRGKPTGFQTGETLRVKLVEPVRVIVS